MFIISLMVYLVIFIIPVFLYLKLHEKVNPLEYLKLNNNIKKNIIKGLLISIFFIAVLLIKNMTLERTPMRFNIGALWLSGSLVGILEEIPFRGFILQKLLTKMNFILADLVTSIFFVLLHIPFWMLNGMNIFSAAKGVFLVSLVLGYLFYESKSLWVSSIFHSIYNLCTWIGLA